MAFSRAPPPTRGQQNLLGFMQMSSGRRFSLEQLMVESGRLELETGQLDPVSSGAAAAAVGGVWCGGGGGGRGSGSHGPLLNKGKFRNLGVNLSWPRHQTWLPKVYQNRPKTETWA